MPNLVNLTDRTLLKLTGVDARSFLQGMISNDITLLKPEAPLFAALLSPQGKFLFDFFLYDLSDSILLDCASAQAEDLTRRLTMYKMRADVDIEVLNDLKVCVRDGTFDEATFQAPDPRHKDMGTRAVLNAGSFVEPKDNSALMTAYYTKAMTLGLPSGLADMGSEKTLILEGNYGEANAVSFTKGCYVGQENTARMMHRNKIRRRLIPIKTETVANIGDVILKGEKKVGEIRHVLSNQAMAYLRVEDFDEELTLEGNSTIHLMVPEFLKQAID